MSLIESAEWDSDVLRANVGRVASPLRPPSAQELAGFDLVCVRLPQTEVALASAYERLGFYFITVDFVLEAKSPPPASGSSYSVRRVAHAPAPFSVSGFTVPGSRFMLDPTLREKLPPRFWDGMIENHCAAFADFCLCVGDGSRMVGFASCFNRPQTVDMFLVAVHSAFTGAGIGAALVQAASREARMQHKKLTTNVVSQNVRALQFYARQGLLPLSGEIVMHWWKNS